MDELKKYRNIKYKKRTRCVICGKKYGKPAIKLPEFPLTEVYVNKKITEKLGFVDQEFHLCANCGHGQIANVIDPKILYDNSYKTRTSTSSSAIAAVDVFLEFINDTLKGRKVNTIFEIGCNDLYMLKKLRNKAKQLYGVDPILKGKEYSVKDRKIKVIGEMFENINLNELGLNMDVVLSSHTLEHIAEPKSMIQDLVDNSSKETTLFFQFPGLESLVSDAHFDQVFHQHLNYFSLRSVLYMLEEVGAELIAYKVNPYHWGALMIAFKKNKNSSSSHKKFRKEAQNISKDHILSQYGIFKKCMDITAQRLEEYINKTIYGYGAALMLPVLNYYIYNLSIINCVIDEDPSKKDLYYLNVPKQIKMLKQIKNIDKSVVLVTAINSMQAIRSIINRLVKLNVEKILVPTNLY
jgi:cyclopropane-fatty-acyl-phospholipid synthase